MDERQHEAQLDLKLPGGRVLPAARLTWRADTSGGPGGQHANRSSTRVEVRVRVDDLPLEAREVELLRQRLAHRITREDEIIAAAGDHRSQLRNRRTAVRRLELLLADALHREPRRRPTRESAGVRMRRRENKQRDAQRKAGRRWRWSGQGD